MCHQRVFSKLIIEQKNSALSLQVSFHKQVTFLLANNNISDWSMHSRILPCCRNTRKIKRFKNMNPKINSGTKQLFKTILLFKHEVCWLGVSGATQHCFNTLAFYLASAPSGSFLEFTAIALCYRMAYHSADDLGGNTSSSPFPRSGDEN